MSARPYTAIHLFSSADPIRGQRSVGFSILCLGHDIGIHVSDESRDIWRRVAVEALSLYARTPEEAQAALDAIARIFYNPLPHAPAPDAHPEAAREERETSR